MTDLALPKPLPPASASAATVAACASRSASVWLSEMPKMPSEPTRRNSRRVGPSQVCPDCPGMTSMVGSYELKRKAFEFSSAHIRSWAAAVRLAEDSKWPSASSVSSPVGRRPSVAR